MTKEEHAKVLAALENSIAVGYDPFGAAKRHDEATAIMRKEPQGWMPIETAPKDGTAIMLGARCGAWIGKYLPIYQSGYKPENPWSSLMLNHDHLSEKRYSPTHWMPLPPPPGKEPEPISDAEIFKLADEYCAATWVEMLDEGFSFEKSDLIKFIRALLEKAR